jgi:hypothetical protein
MGRGGANEETQTQIPARRRDNIVLPCPEWAKQPSTWTIVTGGERTYFIEAPEDLAVATVYAKEAFNPYMPGYYGDAAGEALERKQSSLAKASSFQRNVKLSAGHGDNWDDAVIDETQTRWGGRPTSVEELLADPTVTVLRAAELDFAALANLEELEMEARLAWENLEEF